MTAPRRELNSEAPGIGELRARIPTRCFEPSLWLSLGYIAKDIALVASLAYAATYIPELDNRLLRFVLWLAYSFVQGLVFTGIWILAHECGHGALFKQSKLNNIFGFSLHSMLLVPFYSWKYSHARHHRYTNHMEKDTAFVPTRDPEGRVQQVIEKFLHVTEDTPAISAAFLVLHQLVGWPLYLLFGITSGMDSWPIDESTSQHWQQSGHKSHFDPMDRFWTKDQRLYILLSDIGLAITITGLVLIGRMTSHSTAALLYVPPYLWVNHWLVAITYLHHTHPDVSHFEEGEWTFQKGALATVDRDFGFIGRHFLHGIIEYHVVHHIFPRIPFYRAEEATEAIRPMLGKHYHREDKPFWSELWRTFVSCKYVKPVEGHAGVLRWVYVSS